MNSLVDDGKDVVCSLLWPMLPRQFASFIGVLAQLMVVWAMSAGQRSLAARTKEFWGVFLEAISLVTPLFKSCGASIQEEVFLFKGIYWKMSVPCFHFAVWYLTLPTTNVARHSNYINDGEIMMRSMCSFDFMLFFQAAQFLFENTGPASHNLQKIHMAEQVTSAINW